MPKRPVTSQQPAEIPAVSRGTSAAHSAGPNRGSHPSGLAIIAGKIAPEPQGRAVLARGRLVGWLEQQVDARLILVSAEAGYGKSTMLGEFSRTSPIPCAWYRIDATDGDWITFLSYLVATLRGVIPEFGGQTEALLRHVAAMGSSREMVLAQFLAELGGIGDIRLIVILDDYHLAGDSEDIRLIMGRLLERAPAGMRFVMATRGRPKLALGRLAAQGKVSELTTEDLRFSRSEIEDLFTTAFGQPLDRHACDIVAERTQGWAASLRLVSASIAVSRPGEIGAFIEALDGATGPIYDFLAEEVLTRMSPSLQRVLLHASLVDDVSPPLVAAALSVTEHPLEPEVISAHLDDARSLGLVGASGEGSASSRIHPLFRQFLEHQLTSSSPAGTLRDMHRAIARAAEKTEWLAAAKHYALGDQPEDGMRVLGMAASEALGTGAWGAAVAVVALMPDTTPPPAVEVIKARAATSAGHPAEAIALLDRIVASSLEEDDLALVALARAGALQRSGRSAMYAQEVRDLGLLSHSNPVVNRLTNTWALVGAACQGESISEARRSLDRLAAEAGRAGLTHFAGIALHNAATAALAQADYRQAVQLADSARAALAKSKVDEDVRPSALAVQAVATAELGELADGIALADEAMAAPDLHPDVLADAAFLACVAGDAARAQTIEHRLHRVITSGPAQVGAHYLAEVVRFTRLATQGEFADAFRVASGLRDYARDELDGTSRTLYLIALASALAGRETALEDARAALAATDAQQAWRWEFRARILEAIARADGGDLARWVSDCAVTSPLAILELADVLGGALSIVHPVPQALTQSVARFPARWRPVLRRQIGIKGNPNALIAAHLLSEFGSQEDALVLAQFEQASPRSGTKARLSRALVRRVSPTLRVHDLGRTTYDAVGLEVNPSSARRKALALVLYLVTRPKQTAPREQLMEELWPSQTPASALNSLHQTLHFVRRDIAPWRKGGATADYVALDAEVIYLDPELVQVDSVAFMRQATDALASPDPARTGLAIARLYTGRFAPEFEYEDWAEDWRTLLHAQFLRLSQVTATALLLSNKVSPAIEVLTRAVEVDGMALELRVSLIRALATSGAGDAAADHYRQYANLSKRELGVRAPPLEVLILDRSPH